jgi:pyruvate/2-oxoglutarate dehydrogenase complex dihydrolipoamide dehydrogenase (E3) component
VGAFPLPFPCFSPLYSLPRSCLYYYPTLISFITKKQNNRQYVKGHAAFADSGGPSSLIITPEGSGIRGGVGVGTGGIVTLNANRVLIATGSTPFRPGGIPFDGKRIFDSDSINTLSKLPKSVVITGSGIIAIEYAKIFKNLGSDVTLIIRDSIPRNALMKIGLDKDIAGMLVADLVS